MKSAVLNVVFALITFNQPFTVHVVEEIVNILYASFSLEEEFVVENIFEFGNRGFQLKSSGNISATGNVCIKKYWVSPRGFYRKAVL